MAIFSSKEGDGMSDKQNRTPAREGVLSIIAADLKVVGELVTDGVVKVDGQVQGNVKAERQVLVSKGGVVKGDVHSKEVIVGGSIEGCVYASGRVEVQPSATVNGDIATKRIVVHEGGEVNGNLRMGEAELAGSKLKPLSGPERASTPNNKTAPAAS